MSKPLSIRTSVVLTVAFLGVFAVVLVAITGEIYQRIALNNQQAAISELAGLQVAFALDGHNENTRDLGMALQQNADFRSAFRARDVERLTAQLDSRFNQYLVTAGIVSLKKLTVYDKQFQLIAGSSDVASGGPGFLYCSRARMEAAKRSGADRLKAYHGLCVVNDRPYHTTIVPVGGLRLAGYLQIVDDLTPALAAVEHGLGLPIELRQTDGKILYRSAAWPDDSQPTDTTLIAEYTLQDDRNADVLTIAVSRDLVELFSALAITRYAVLAVAVLMTLLVMGVILFWLRNTLVRPLRSLGTQVRSICDDQIHLGELVQVQGSPEIQELETAFNEMSTHLEGLYRHISDNNRELEEEVADRTRTEEELRRVQQEMERMVESRGKRLEALHQQLRERASR